ncbi:hypothetical protein AY606_15375 [Acinetobacter sp. SFB]|uniref:hypothetical protein n=1 Tax=Acinetobacter sp. SFB TaxID=1805634 RepID=UPI0007D77FC0|nr:hypothetical protein [Acinetobacter sp. SFB]OAL80772.1 hypothetical protein AY606_15375 [Acinetobacter sp. SFB]
MSTNFQAIIDNIISFDFSSINARKIALSGHHELYHFQMALKEFGEEALLQEVAKILKNRYRYTHSDAYNEAAIRIRALLEICGGDKTFRTARDNLRG